MADLSTYAGRQAVRDAAAAAGQSVVVDAGGVFNQNTGQTTSGNEFVGSGAASGGGGGPAPTPAPGDDNTAALQKISAGFAASSGMSQKQLDEQIREFDQTLEFQKQQWREKGLPEIAIQQRAQDLEEKKFAELTAEAARQQSFVEEIGRRQATLAEKAQSDANAVAQGQLSLGQQQLGLDAIKTAASFSGPQDWIKAANFNRGVRQSNLPSFITNLLTGQSNAPTSGPAPGATLSAPNSMAGYASALGATPLGGNTADTLGTGAASIGSGASDTDYAANRLRQVFAAGGQALGPQQLEGLSPTELSMFTGGGADLGADVNGFLDVYKKSRIGQTAALPGVV